MVTLPLNLHPSRATMATRQARVADIEVPANGTNILAIELLVKQTDQGSTATIPAVTIVI